MVRSIDSNLTTVINGHTKRPALTMTIEDHTQHWTLYQSPGVADGWNDACIASDNSIVRVMVTRNGFASTFSYQRITDPAQASQWSTWTAFSGGSGNMFQDGGCAVMLYGGTLYAFAQQGTGGNAIYYWTSTNNGASWSGPGTVLSPPGGALCRGMGSSGNGDLFFIYDVTGGEGLGASFYSFGSWSALHAWTLATLTGGSGIAPIYSGGVYTLVYSDGYDLFSCTYNPGSNTWSQDSNIAPATSTAIARLAPRACFADGVYTVTCIEADSGLLTGITYSYPRLRQSADLVHWSNGTILHDLSGTVTFGACYLKLPAPQSGNAGARYYLFTTQSVYSCQIFNQANFNQYVDVSAQILSYKRVERQGKPAHIEVLLDNTSGQLNALVTSGATYEPIGPNTTIVVSEGYYTGSPPNTKDVVQVGRYRINQIHFERTPQENQVRLIGLDRSRNLDLQARYQQTYNNWTVGSLLLEVCARAGLFSVSLPATSQINQSVPQFVIHAGRAYRAALDELCTVYGLAYFLDQNETMQFRELSSSDASVWSYQPEIEMVSFVTNDLRANHIIVSGKPPTTGQAGALTEGEAYDDAHIKLVGQEQLLHVVDQKLLTTAQCTLRASLTLAQEQRQGTQHTVQVPANPALQLLDVITLTDSAAPAGSGQSGNARIWEQTIMFDAQHAEYSQQMALIGA